MGKFTILKKLLGKAEDNKGKIAENVSKKTSKVDQGQVENAVVKASDKVNSK